MPACLRMTSRLFPCSFVRSGSMLLGAAGPLPCKCAKSVQAQRNGKLARNYWRRLAGAKSMSCWSGGWTAGAARSPICSQTLQELEHLNVGFVSLTEALDLTTPAGRAMAGLLAIFSEFEREILRERTLAGLAEARQNGKRLGRPATAAVHTAEIRKLHHAGVSKSEIARRLAIGRTSVRRVLGTNT